MSSSDAALRYVRDYYRVPARRGQRILYTSTAGDLHLATITGGSDAHLIVRFDKNPKRKERLHPTWHVCSTSSGRGGATPAASGRMRCAGRSATGSWS